MSWDDDIESLEYEITSGSDGRYYEIRYDRRSRWMKRIRVRYAAGHRGSGWKRLTAERLADAEQWIERGGDIPDSFSYSPAPPILG